MKRDAARKRRYWFVNRRYGIGWKPATWEGYTLVIATLGIWFSLALTLQHTSESKYLPLSLIIVGTIAILIMIATGEPLRWRSGGQ